MTVALPPKIVCKNTASCEIFMFEDESICAHSCLICVYGDLMRISMCLPRWQ